jgi:hypothetical protein
MPQKETASKRDQRLKELVFTGAPLPEGIDMPYRIDPPALSNYADVSRVREEIERLKQATFSSWVSVPSDLSCRVVVPATSGTWMELAELGKLNALQHWINWEGVSKRDCARMVMDHVDVANLPEKVQSAVLHDSGAFLHRETP